MFTPIFSYISLWVLLCQGLNPYIKVLTPTSQNVTSFRKRVIAIGYKEIILSRVDSSSVRLVSLVKEGKWTPTYADKTPCEDEGRDQIDAIKYRPIMPKIAAKPPEAKVRGTAELLSYRL